MKLVLLLFLGSVGLVTSLKLNAHYKYVIVGAGPGGVQASYYMTHHKMDYVTLERHDHAGSFFDRYPRHRNLISINKASVPSSDPEFALRHDWNSLLQEPNDGGKTALLFKNFTRKYYPTADFIPKYLKAYVEKHNLNIAFSHDVSNVHKNSKTNLFEITYTNAEGKRGVITSEVLLIGTGKDVPLKPQCAKGNEFITRYDQISMNVEDYRGKEVLIFGSGNSALETADWMQDYAAHVHIGGRRPMIFAFQTHYVGDSRAINLQILDKYQLKSLDAVFSNLYYHDLKFKKEGDRIHLEYESEKDKATSPLRRGYHHIIGVFGFKWNDTIFDETTMPRLSACGKMPVITSEYESANVTNLFFIGNLMHARDFKKSAGGFIHGFRYVIKTLTHMLRDRFEGIPMPFTKVPIRFYEAGGWTYPKLTEAILARVNSAGSMYQMFGSLGDVYVLDDLPSLDNERAFADAGVVNARLYQDIGIDTLKHGLPFHHLTKKGSRYLTVTLEYGDDFQGIGTMLHRREKTSDYMKKRRIVVHDYEEDPDEEYKRRFVPEHERVWPYRSPTGTAPRREATKLEEQQKTTDSFWRNNITELAPESDYEDSNKFIHPVIRAWVRHEQIPTLVGTHHITEDFLTDWTLPEYRKELSAFLQRTIQQFIYGAPHYNRTFDANEAGKDRTNN
jgi:thioredoxin reductase